MPLKECQFIINGKVKGSSACVGICLKMTECFLIKSDFRLDGIKEQIREKYISVISEMVNYWNLYSLSTMDVSREFSLLIFENLRKAVEMKEKKWHEKTFE